MKFSVNQKDLQQSLGFCQGVIEKRSTLPILSNILLEAYNSKLKIINMKNGDYNLAWTHYKNIPLAIGKIKNSVFYPFRVLNLYKNITN